jgi:hypothetical protein
LAGKSGLGADPIFFNLAFPISLATSTALKCCGINPGFALDYKCFLGKTRAGNQRERKDSS